MQKEEKRTERFFRTSRTNHDLLWDMYHNSGFTEELGYGFGYEHKKSGLKVIMPQFFYELWNGRWLDPGYARQVSVEGLQEFLGMKIDCRLNVTVVLGKLMKGLDGKKWFVLPGLVEDWDDELTDILLTVEWNVMNDTDAHGLLQIDVESAVGEIRHWREEADARSTDGVQYIVLPVGCFKSLKRVWIHEWKQLLTKANRLLDEFDLHKSDYKRMFRDGVIPRIPVEDGYTWRQTDDETMIVWTNVRGDRSTSTQHFRHDGIGWQACLKEYDFLKDLRE